MAYRRYTCLKRAQGILMRWRATRKLCTGKLSLVSTLPGTILLLSPKQANGSQQHQTWKWKKNCVVELIKDRAIKVDTEMRPRNDDDRRIFNMRGEVYWCHYTCKKGAKLHTFANPPFISQEHRSKCVRVKQGLCQPSSKIPFEITHSLISSKTE